MRYLRHNTATVVEIGPAVDVTDGATLEEGLTVASIDVQLMQPLDTAAVPPDRVTNGAFGSDANWTKNSWTIGAGVADSASAQSTTLSQTPSVAWKENVAYEITYDVVARSAGSVLVSIGGTDGTARSSVATFTETLIAGSGSLTEFKASSFTGQIDNVVIKQVPIPITPAASGSTNDMVLTQSNTGTYWLEITANQVGIVGRHKLTAFITDALIMWEEFMVIEAEVWDDLFASGAKGYLKASTPGNDLDVSSGGEAGVDWANVGGKTTVVDLTNTKIKTATDVETDTGEIQGKLPTNKFMGSSDGADDDGVLNAITPAGPTKTEMDNAHAALATPAQVNTEMKDIMETDTHTELSAVPSVPLTYQEILLFMAALARNRLNTTATSMQIYKDDASTVMGTSVVSDDGTTAERGEFS